MRLHLTLVTLVLISSKSFGDFIAKSSEKAKHPSLWKVGDVLEGVGKVTAIEPKEGKYLVKATRDGYKIEIVVHEDKLQ